MTRLPTNLPELAEIVRNEPDNVTGPTVYQRLVDQLGEPAAIKLWREVTAYIDDNSLQSTLEDLFRHINAGNFAEAASSARTARLLDHYRREYQWDQMIKELIALRDKADGASIDVVHRWILVMFPN